jgi:hypothetical protein
MAFLSNRALTTCQGEPTCVLNSWGIQTMRLWTWQNRAFDLADSKQRVCSLEFSVYTTHAQLTLAMKDKHKEAYEKIFSRLGTDQLIWCSHQYEDAVSSASIAEFETLGRVLWEVDVRCEDIKWHCHAAWTCLRTGRPDLPDRMGQVYRELSFSEAGYAKKFQDDFMTYWGQKTDEELLDLMFLNRPENDCSGAIAFHPISTIVRNPLVLGKWWEEHPSRPTGLRQRDGPVELPCPDCPGRSA